MPKDCRVQTCMTPWCTSTISISKSTNNRKKTYCDNCNTDNEINVLILQTEHGKHIKELLLEQALLFNFKSLSILSDALETQISYTRRWIKIYFNCDWDEFRIKYGCKYNECAKVDVSDFKNKYYILKQLKDNRICCCLTKDNFVLVKTKSEEHKITLSSILNKK